MIKGRDIIVMGIQAWDIEIGSNCKNIASQMAKNNRVLYVNPPMDRISRYRERHTEKIRKRIAVKKGEANDLVEIGGTMWNLYPKTMTESINFIKNKNLFDWLNRINAKRFANDIKSAIERLGFKNYIIFNDSSMFLGQHIKTLLKPSFYVYYMRDYLTKNPYWRKNGVRLEPKLIQSADCVVNNSTLYTEYGKQFTEHSYMVGQGCDTSLFNDEVREITIPDDLNGIPGPIVGYVGFLSSRRLSIGILVHIAKSRPDWSVVLVGPEDDKFNTSELHEIDNVYFLGSRDASELPNYIKGFDVAINPQLINDATMGNYPRKIDEYLAMGKPTVASATKAMEYFKEYTYLGVTPEDYLELIEKALSENDKELEKKRKAYGLSHSWENNVNEIYNCILQVERASA
ncbi:MAG: glycosyltransferase [Bacteroidota bacterium]